MKLFFRLKIDQPKQSPMAQLKFQVKFMRMIELCDVTALSGIFSSTNGISGLISISID